MIKSKNTDKVYIGSTQTPLYSRKAKHNYNYKKWKSGEKKYMENSKFIYEAGEPEFIILEEYKNITKKELLEYEQDKINKHPNCYNSHSSCGGRKKALIKYRENNKTKIKDSNIKYLQSEKGKQKRKEYNEINKEKMKKYHKEYREKIKQKNKSISDVETKPKPV